MHENEVSFELQPHLIGDIIELRPLRAEDWEGLFLAASDPTIWQQHPVPNRYQEDVFKVFFQEALSSGGALVAIDRQRQIIIGSSRYFGFDPAKSEIEIGWTFLSHAYWGGNYNGEMKQLMLHHAFRFVDNVIFLVATTNNRSRKALEKIGAVLTDQLRKVAIHGNVIEHVVYQINRLANH